MSSRHATLGMLQPLLLAAAILLLLLLLDCTSAAATSNMPQAVISSLQPNAGSMAGGTYLVIKGSGWSRGGVPGTTTAYLIVNGVRRECVRNQGIILDSTDTNYVCWSPPIADVGVRPRMWFVAATVQVVLTSLDGTSTSIAKCAGSCTFYYDAARTLSIGYASQGGYAGSVVKAFGTLWDADATHYWMRVGGDVAGGAVGGALCVVDGRLQMGVNGNGGASKLANPGGTVLCRLGVSNATSEAGRYPLHVESRDNSAGGRGNGASFFSVLATQNHNLLPQYSNPAAGGGGVVTSQSIGFGITIWPLVTGVSVTNVGLGGGVTLTITGNGFSTLGNNQVTLGNGVPCTVTSSHMNSLTCVTGATTVAATTVKKAVLYPGGTGLMHKVYILQAMGPVGSPKYVAFSNYLSSLFSWAYWYGNKRTKRAEPSLPAGLAPQFAEVNADSLVGRFGYYGSSVVDQYSQELTGFFVPPVTANYSFYVRGDDFAAVYLSTNMSPKNVSLVAVSKSYNYNWWFGDPTNQISNKVSLVKGQPYYFRVLHADGGGGDFFDVAVRVHSEGGRNQAVAATLGSDYQRATRITYNIVYFEVVADGGTFALSFKLQGVPVTTAPIPVTTSVKDDITNAILAATGGAQSPFTDWGYTSSCSVPSQPGCYWASDAGWQIALDRGVGDWTDNIFYDNLWVTDYKGGQSGFAVKGNTQNSQIYTANSKKVALYLQFWGPMASNLTNFHVVTRGAAPGTGLPFAATSSNASRPVTSNVRVVQDGSSDPFYWPIPADFFRTAVPLPPVLVRSNGLLAACNHLLPINTSKNASAVRYNQYGSTGYYAPLGYGSVFPNTTAPGDLNGCSVVYDVSITPTLTSVTGTLATGNTLTIAGTKFLPVSAGVGLGPGGTDLGISDMNTVLLLGHSGLALHSNASFPCPVTAATATQLTCTVPKLTAGGYKVRVIVGLGRGIAVQVASRRALLAAPDDATNTLPICCADTAAPADITVTPASGSRAGGTVLTVSGMGFSNVVQPISINNVTVGNSPCKIIYADTFVINCVTPPTGDASMTTAAAIAASSTVTSSLWVNGVETAAAVFTYAGAATPVLDWLFPTSVAFSVTSFIHLVLSNVPAAAVAAAWRTDSTTLTVNFGNRTCGVTNATAVSAGARLNVTCLLVRVAAPPVGSQAALTPLVYVAPYGYAAVDGSNRDPASGHWALDASFQVATVGPRTVSMAGGTALTISGSGFPAGNPSAVTAAVQFVDTRFGGHNVYTAPCSVLSVAATGRSLQCVLARPDYEGTPYLMEAFVPMAQSHPYAFVSNKPSVFPTSQPSRQPTSQPSTQPTHRPSSSAGRFTPMPSVPTSQPTTTPTGQPTRQPAGKPTSQPSESPTMQPSAQPIAWPSSQPTESPTGRPTSVPTRTQHAVSARPTGQPTCSPTMQPTEQPTNQPSSRPSKQSVPTRPPTSQPTSTMQIRSGRLWGQVIVTSNNIDATCVDAAAHCGVTLSADVTPEVTEMAVINGVANITGRLLLPPINVWFGTVLANNATLRALDASGRTVTIRPPAQTAGPLSLFMHTKYGNVANAWAFSYFKRVAVTSVTTQYASTGAAGGSVAGGDVINILGDGFSPTLTRNIVKFGASVGVVTGANYTHLTVLTPPYVGTAATATVDVSVTVLDPFLKRSVDIATLAQSYTYATAATPVLGSLTPTTVRAGTTLSVGGANFGVAGTVGNAVTVGGVPCAVTAWSNVRVNCTVGSTPAGTHTVLVDAGAMGYAQAKRASTVVVPLTVLSPATVVVGPGGGAVVTVTGSGFAPTAGPGSNSTNNVTVCGVIAPVLRATSTSLTFAVPKLHTVTANDLYNTFEDEVLTPASVSPTYAAAAFDGLTTTVFGACTVTVDLGPWSVAVVSKIRFFPRFGDYAPWSSSVFAAANSTKGPWTTLYKVPSTGVLDGWNYQSLGVRKARLLPLTRYRYLKWTAGPNSDCQGMEMEFTGRRFTVNEGRACPVNVTVSTPAQPPFTSAVATRTLRVATVNVESTNIPVVYSIQPRYGTALGGDRVQITGQGFALGTGVANVTLNGMPCKVRTFNATSISCVTTPRRSIEPPSVGVLVGGMGLALVNDTSTCYFSYLDRWSQLTTWYNNEPPGEGDTVVVPKGQAILVDVSPPRLFLVLIQGEMTFDATVPHISFNASYIAVLGGKLTIGTEAEPLRNKVTITLHGDRTTSIELPGFGAKTLGVMNTPREYGSVSTTAVPANDPGLLLQQAQLAAMQQAMGSDFGQQLGSYGAYVLTNASASATDILTSLLATTAAPNQGAAVPYLNRGVVDIHGAPRQRVWTFGAAPAMAGTKTLALLEPVDYQPGETIFVTYTGLMADQIAGGADMLEHETAVVASRPDANTVILAAPLKYDHECFTYTRSQSTGFSDTRICYEVGLLSRNIVIQGDDASAEQQFGMHSIAAMGATMRVENVEWRNCGQSLIVGRYCMHFHLLADEGMSYARANSFHNGFQRAVTIHASNNVHVTDNVAFKIMAHSFFVEDGVELGIVLEGNLVAGQLTSPGPIRSDASAACFWTASPANHWRNNVCAGASNGYWFQPPAQPTGPSYTDRVIPYMLPLGSFYNNTAHSTTIGLNAWIAGAKILCSMQLQQFSNSTFWRNGQGVFLGELSSSVQFSGFKILESTQFAFGWYFMACGSSVFTTRPQLTNSLFVATLDPIKNPASMVGAVLFPQNEYFYASGLTFVDYVQGAPLSSCVAFGCVCGWQGGAPFQSDVMNYNGFTQRVDRLRFINSPYRAFWDRTDVMVDLDGSLSGAPMQYVSAYSKFNAWPECTVSDALGAGILASPYPHYGAGLHCLPNQAIRRVQFAKMSPGQPYSSEVWIMGGAPGQRAGIWNGQQNKFMFSNANRTGYASPPYAQDTYVVSPVFVTNHHYGLAWNSLVDPQTFIMRYAEPDYLNTSTAAHDWVGLTIGMIQPRYDTTFNYPSFGLGGACPANNFPCSNLGQIQMPLLPKNTVPPPGSAFGTATFPGRPNNNTVTVMLSPNISAQSRLWSNHNASTRGRGRSNDGAVAAYTLDVTYNLCPPAGCNAVPTGTLGAATLWSSYPELMGLKAGNDLTLSPTQYIILDVSPPPLGVLTIQGRLEFLSTAKNLTLTASSIVVWGSLAVGSQAKPFAGNANIVLTGSLLDNDVVVDNKQIVGHKAIVNLGNVTLFGKPAYSKTWTRLASTANAAATTLTLVDNPGWAVGSRVVVSQTEYSSFNNSLSQVETNTVTAVSADGKTLTLKTPLKYRHYAGPLSTNAASPASVRGQYLRAAVGLLTRNVVIKGDMVRYSSSPTFGAHIYTGTVVTGTGKGAVTWRGQLTMSSVEFQNYGKDGMNFRGINLEYPATPPTAHTAHKILNCSFNGGFNGALMSHGSLNTAFSNNVVYASYSHGVYFDPASVGATVTANLVVGNYLSVWTYMGGRGLPTSAQMYSQGAMVLGGVPALLADNVVSGAYDTGYILAPQDCTAPSRILRNEAAGTTVGFFVLKAGSGLGLCKVLDRVLDRVTAWKAAHMGVTFQDAMGNIRLSNALLADNHIGFTAYVSSGAQTQLMVAEVVNSTVVGTSPASTCAASVACRAMSRGPDDKLGKNCNSALGGVGVRRAGIQQPQFVNDNTYTSNWAAGFDYPMVNAGMKGLAIPWDRKFGGPMAPFVRFTLRQLTFSGFAGPDADCGLSSYAVAMSPGELDFSVPTVASGIIWDTATAPAASRVYLGTSLRPLFIDTDGTLLGASPGSTLLANTQGAARQGLAEPSCVNTPTLGNGTLCPGIVYRTGSLINIDMRNGGSPYVSIVLGVENYQQGANVQRLTSPYAPVATPRTPVLFPLDQNAGMSINDMSPDSNEFHVLPGSTTLIRMLNTEPVQSRITFSSPDPKEKVLFQLFLTRPNSQKLFIDGVAVTTRNDLPLYAGVVASNIPLPNVTDPHGTAVFRPDLRSIFFVAQGGYHFYDVVRVASVSVAFGVSIPPGSSLAAVAGPVTNALAQLLGISASRIKVVSVHSNRRMLLEDGLDDFAEGADGKKLEVWRWESPEHRRLQTGAVTLALEILPDTPTVALSGTSTVTTTSTTTTSSTTTTAASASAARNATVATYKQQTSMLALGTKVFALAVSGNVTTTIAKKTGLTVGAVAVVPPAVTVALPQPAPAPLAANATAVPTAAPTSLPPVVVRLAFQNLPAAAFDPANSFAPTAATLVAFSSSFRKTIAALYGPSGLTVTVTNVTDALNGKTLYTLAAGAVSSGATQPPTSVRVFYQVTASLSASLTMVSLVGGRSDFAAGVGADLSSTLSTQLTIAGVPGNALLSGIPTAAPTTAPPSATPTTTAAPTVVGQTWAPSTAAPSATPSTAPTAAPTTTGAPSTATPSTLPTVAPTILSKLPSCVPTATPTAAAGAPTTAPTVPLLVQVQVTQTIAGVTAATAQTNAFKASFVLTVGYTLGVPAAQVAVLSVTAAPTSRRAQLASVAVVVQYVVTTYNTPAAQVQATLAAAVGAGTFTAALQTNGYPGATATAVPTMVDVSPTSAPTAAPVAAKAAGVDPAGIAGIVVALVGVLVFAFVNRQSAARMCGGRRSKANEQLSAVFATADGDGAPHQREVRAY